MRWWPALGLLMACGSKEDPGDTAPSGIDADADADADTDVDADADADTDTDTDTDADTDTDTDTGSPIDLDGDGFSPGQGDCDDLDDERNPGADEVCDGVDQDCDEAIDEDALDAAAWFVDADGDGHGDPDAPFERACSAPPGRVTTFDDCNDALDTVYPGAPEAPCDGQDNDCDPLTLPAGRVTLEGVEQPTLAAALAAARTGQRIELCEGDYLENNLVITVDDLVVSGAGAGATLLNGRSRGPLLKVTGRDVVLEGLSLTGGSGEPQGLERVGGGIWVSGSATLREVEVEGNRSTQAGGLYVTSSGALVLEQTVVRDNVVIGSVVSSRGGAGVVEAGGRLELIDSQLLDNLAEACGGLDLYRGATVEGTGDARIEDNEATAGPGGGACSAGARLVGVELRANEAAQAGGGVSAAGVELIDCRLVENVADDSGGGLSGTGSLVVRGGELRANITALNGGGVHASAPGTTLLLEDVAVQSNRALFRDYKDPDLVQGGGVALQDGPALTFTRVDWGGAPEANDPADVQLVLSDVFYDYEGTTSGSCEDVLGGVCR